MPDATIGRIVDLAILVIGIGTGAVGAMRTWASSIDAKLDALHDDLRAVAARVTESEGDIEGLERREDE